MLIQFFTPIPIGATNDQIMSSVKKELELIHSKANIGLGKFVPERQSDEKLYFSFEENTLSPEIEGEVEINTTKLQAFFKIEVPDCHIFRKVIGETFIGSFDKINVPLMNVTV